MAKPTNFDHATHRTLERLVAQNVRHSLCYTIELFTNNPAAFAESGWDYEDDVLPLLSRDDWNEPAEWWVDNDASFADLVDACEAFDLEPDYLQCEALRELIGEALRHVPAVRLVNALNVLQASAGGFIAADDPNPEATLRAQCTAPLAAALQDCEDVATLGEAMNALSDADNDTGEKERFYALRGGLLSWLRDDDDNARELCERVGIDPHTREAFEFWAVDSWFAGKLAEHGECVGELLDFHVWGRCTTGQAISMDGVIREIADSMQILPGQANAWEGGEL